MNVLALFAHPDDETMLAGGTLALLAGAGAQVHYLCATRGEGGEVGEPPLCTPEELGEMRARELSCAVTMLGGVGLAFLDYRDPTVGPGDALFAFTDDLETLAGEVSQHLHQKSVEVLITHGSNGEYGHPAHIITHRAAIRAVQSYVGGVVSLYTVAATFPGNPKPRLANQDDPAHLVLDVTPVLARKEQAALCHRTQNALFMRRSSKEAGRQLGVGEVLMRVESLRRVVPADIPVENDPVFGVLGDFGVLPGELE